jgi:integrase
MLVWMLLEQAMSTLSARRVETLKEPGFYGDGDGLYLSVKPSGAKSWILRTVVHGKRRDLGVGSADFVALGEARDKARDWRKIAREGGDPYASRNAKAITFEEATAEYHRLVSQSFRSQKHAAQWMTGMKRHVFPAFGERMISTIGVVDVRKALEPIWIGKHETARKIKQRIEAVFDWARAEGHYGPENPARGIKRALKPQPRNPTHLAAMPWSDLPAFYKSLTARDGVSARTLQFIILTAVRSGEAREARWVEFNGNLWTIPANRMKTGRTHVVPLAPEAVRILDEMRGFDPVYVFPARSRTESGASKPQSINVFRALYDRMGCDGFTTHGFRSTFRDWCGEETDAPREVAEAALAHMPGQVERAYRRSTALERRRVLMDQWAAYAISDIPCKPTSIPASEPIRFKPRKRPSIIKRSRPTFSPTTSFTHPAEG